MTARKSPTVRKRRLIRALRQFRMDANITLEVAAAHLAINYASLSRIETGVAAVRVPYVESLLRFYNVPEEQHAELVQLARDAKQRGWWQPYKDILSSEYADFIGFETEASETRTYELDTVPGILETEDYARALISAQLPGAAPEDIEKRVKLRASRQDRLREDPKLRVWAILGEAALRYQVGGKKVLREQLDYLLELQRQPNITIQVLPFSAGAHPGMAGPFVILAFDKDPDIVYLEGLTSALYLEDSGELERYRMVFERLLAEALSPAASDQLIREASKELCRSNHGRRRGMDARVDDLARARWRKGSRTQANGNCVEVALVGSVYVRDSKLSTVGAFPTLAISSTEWNEFLSAIATDDNLTR
ncbi:Scr1 family TA system antitoxin-like transcriptional regulator [Stackebrandtia soli]|uniref:Scr1 family TA system antitoxin-like transcriptional regulator n=1 Tax=Stackebrandtia soli TaxID=1892856 RepID=UPI0039EACE77